MMGNVPEWVSALGAAGALVAAIYAAIVSRRLFGIEAGRDRMAMEREKRTQASDVAAWCVYCPTEDEGGKFGILIQNSSGSPVYDVRVESTYRRKYDTEPVQQKPITLAILPPGEFVCRTHPTFNWTYPEDREFVDVAIRPITKNRDWVVRSIAFTDAHGISWMRHEGRLVEVTGGAEKSVDLQSKGTAANTSTSSARDTSDSTVMSFRLPKTRKKDSAKHETKRRMRQLGIR